MTSNKLDLDQSGKSVSEKVFQGMIGSLLYLRASRPNIIFNVCLCAGFQGAWKESHRIAVNRIFKYLAGTKDIGLRYPKDEDLNLIEYSDIDYAWYKLYRKSTSAYCQFFGHSLVSWHLKKLDSVVLSTTESEYIVGVCYTLIV